MQKDDTKKKYSTISVEKKGTVEAIIKGEIDAEVLMKHYDDELRHIASHLNIDGFRHGHVPISVAEKHAGETAILEKASEKALQETYPEIIIEQKLNIISRPEIAITKLAKNNPLGFTIKVALLPEFELPNYQEIRAKFAKKEIVVEKPKQEEIDKTLNKLLEQKNKETKDENSDTLFTANDDFAKSFGLQSLDELKSKIRDGLKQEKEHKARDVRRAELIDDLVKPILDTELPEVLVQGELSRMKQGFKHDVEKLGMKFDDYLKEIKKTESEIEAEWRPDAKKRVLLQLSINKIATKESISADPKQVAHETDHILQHEKDADRERVESYVEIMLINNMVLDYLEGKEITPTAQMIHHDHSHDDESSSDGGIKKS